MTAGALLVTLYTLRDFGTVSLMRYTTFTRALYVQYQSSFDRTGAAALALVLVGITLSILWWERRTRAKGEVYHENGASRRPPTRFRLGAWRWPALAACVTVVTLALALPAGVLSYWLARGLMAGQSLAPLWHAARNSLLASAAAALATVVAAIPVVVLIVRRPGRLTPLVDQIAHSGFALPGIVVALALVFFGIRYAPVAYQSLPMLIAAYGILFLPQALGPIRVSLLQVPPALEEASRSLGRTPAAAYREIVLPLLRPGILAGAGLVFLTTMKELQATLILGPYGFRTLAVEVWSAVTEAYFARAAAPALLIIAASSIPMAILVLRQEKGRAR
jgi:iron(III) transport system permease protein